MSDKSPTPLVNFNPTEPISKLVEAVRGAVGTLYEPTRIRRKAEAEADAAKIAAKTEVDIAKIKLEGIPELQELALRANERINYRELRRQRNIESVVSKAVHQLPESVSDEKVDEDWIVQFFNYAQDVGNEEMQTLWARLLAGEVAEPGSFSLRTLHTIKMLSPFDAALFEHLCNYLWNESIYLSFDSVSSETQAWLNDKRLSNNNLLHLESLNCITGAGRVIQPLPDDPLEVDYFGKRYRFCVPEDNESPESLWGISMQQLTKVGEELRTLCDPEPDEEYCNALVQSWRRDYEVHAI